MIQIMYFVCSLFLMGNVFCSQGQEVHPLVQSLREVKNNDGMKLWCIGFFEQGIGYRDFGEKQREIARALTESPYKEVCNQPIEELNGRTFCQNLVSQTGGSCNYIDALEMLFANRVVDANVSGNDRRRSTIGDCISSSTRPGRFLPVLKYLNSEDLFKEYDSGRKKETLFEIVFKTGLGDNESKLDTYLQSLAENLSNRFISLFKIVRITSKVDPGARDMNDLYGKIKSIWLSRIGFGALVATCVLLYKKFA